MKPTKQVALGMGCEYIYDEWGRVNKKADKVKEGATLIVETLVTNGVFDFKFSPNVRTSRTQIFAFLTHCDFDFEGEEVGEKQDAMEAVARTFIARLNALGLYEYIEVTEWNAVLDFLDANMVGVRVTLTLKEIKGECVENV